MESTESIEFAEYYFSRGFFFKMTKNRILPILSVYSIELESEKLKCNVCFLKVLLNKVRYSLPPFLTSLDRAIILGLSFSVFLS